MIIHTSLNIDGAIKNAKMLKGCITVGGRVLNTVEEVRHFLYQQKAIGREVLPIGDCDNFDYKKGCLGHPSEDEMGTAFFLPVPQPKHGSKSCKEGRDE